MNKFTSADYIKAVKEAIEEAKKSSEYDYILLNPSPAKLRDICMAIYTDKASGSDKKIFEHFFKLNTDLDVTRQFLNFNVDKLRPVRNFIIGDSGKPSFTIVELLAILADYEKRPLRKFLGGVEELVKDEIDEKGGEANKSSESNSPIHCDTLILKKKKKNWIIVAVITFVVFVGGLMTNKLLIEKPGCMFWNESHFEVIDCNSQMLGFASYRKIVPGQEHLLKNFKKLEVNPNSIFFENGKAVVWYGKNAKGIYEYFSFSGEHPETGKHLKPITNYHINKYVKLD